MTTPLNLRRYALCTCLLAGGLGVHASAQAAAEFGEDTLSLKLGVFLSDFDTTLGYTGPNGGSGSIKLEDNLGLDSNQTTFRGEAMWRFAPRHRIGIGYYSFNRDALRTVQEDVVLDLPNGNTYEFSAGATVSSEFDWRLIPVTYSYSFYKREDIEVAALAGIHWFEMNFGLTGQVSINGGAPITATANAGTTSGPLPVIGLRADYKLTPKWLLGGHVQWFGLDYEDYSGELLDLRLQTEYWFTDRVGAGLGYTWYDIDVTETKTTSLGTFRTNGNQTYQGLEAYVGVRF